MSGKYILSAAGLILASRVGPDRIEAVIDPGSNRSEISARLAERLHLPVTVAQTVAQRHLTIGIAAEQFDADTIAVGSSFPSGVDLRIGQDILRQHVFVINSQASSISLVIPGDYRHETKGMGPVTLRLDDNGTWWLPIVLRNGQSTEGAFRLSNPYAICPDRELSAADLDYLRLGPVDLGPIEDVNCPPQPSVTFGPLLFKGRKIVLDLPHKKLWVSPATTSSGRGEGPELRDDRITRRGKLWGNRNVDPW